MDAYEHAYKMDFGAAAARSIDAFFQNLDWQVVDRRYERASELGSAVADPRRFPV